MPTQPAGKNFSAATPERQHIESQINSNAQVWGWGGSLANTDGVNYTPWKKRGVFHQGAANAATTAAQGSQAIRDKHE